jgi:hypothetical protein
MKRVSIKKAASQEMPRDLELEPGTTVYDVLKAVRMELGQFTVSIPSGEMLPGHDGLYARVNDGDKLLISERATVGV